MINQFCLTCGKLLTGKQRKYCSEAHRKRYERANKSGHSLTAFVLKSSGFGRELTGNVRKFSNKRTFEVKFTVIFASNEVPGDWDVGLINDYLKFKVAQIVREVLLYEQPGWEIEVKLDYRYAGMGT